MRCLGTGIADGVQLKELLIVGKRIVGDGFAEPYVLYDDQAGRFYIAAIEFNFNTGIASVDFAVSKTSTPGSLSSADWNFYKISTTESGS